MRVDRFQELDEAVFKSIYAWLTDKKVEPLRPLDTCLACPKVRPEN